MAALMRERMVSRDDDVERKEWEFLESGTGRRPRVCHAIVGRGRLGRSGTMQGKQACKQKKFRCRYWSYEIYKFLSLLCPVLLRYN